MVDLDPQALYAKGLSPLDVSNAINAQNLILPAGDAKIGDRDYTVLLNSSPTTVGALNDLPVKHGQRRDRLHPGRRPRPRRLRRAAEPGQPGRQARGPADRPQEAGLEDGQQGRALAVLVDQVLLHGEAVASVATSRISRGWRR